jgi:hypothetical protein
MSCEEAVSLKVLVVDDEQLIANTLMTILINRDSTLPVRDGSLRPNMSTFAVAKSQIRSCER